MRVILLSLGCKSAIPNLVGVRCMVETKQIHQRKVLITSANPLFARGLEAILRQGNKKVKVNLLSVSNMAETHRALDGWQPDLVIVDYDDKTINREEFLSHFLNGSQPMQLMLVSLQATGQVVIYDRRTLSPAQAEDWLSLTISSSSEQNLPHLPEE
jgi:hypothetical protein